MQRNKKCWCMVIIIVVIQCIFALLWGTQRERHHVDEMFTMEGVKLGGVAMQYWDLQEDFYGSEHTNQEFMEHMTVNSDELLLRQGIGEVGKALLSRNLYYTMVNLAASVAPGHVPWEAGVGLNLIFFVMAQMVLYAIVKRLVGETAGVWAVILYGFSSGAVSTILYVRCYMVLTACILLVFYIYLRFVDAEGRRQKAICIVSSGALAYICYRIHQFGTILFVITLFLFLVYMIVKKKKNQLCWMAVGYGIPLVIGSKVIIARAVNFLSAGVAPLFYDSLHQFSLSRIWNLGIQMLKILENHLYIGIWLIILMAGCIIRVRQRNKVGGNDISEEKGHIWRMDWELLCMPLLITGGYYVILVLGGAVAWRYLSPSYPYIVMILVMLVMYVFPYECLSRKAMIVCSVAVIVALIALPNKERISEMYPGEKEYQAFLEENYHGVNGIMVHHDYQGIGENWLYEAACLWPQDSEILVTQNKVLKEKRLCYNRNDDRILLWLTVDYDREECVRMFRESTEYTDVELVLATEHLYVYECNK